MVIFRGKFSIEFEIQFDLSPAKLESSAEKEKTQTVTRTPAHISFLREYGKVRMYLGISGLWDN